MLSGDLLVLQAAIAPTPIIFLMTLKELVLASAQQTPSAAASAASPALGAGPAFHTPMASVMQSALAAALEVVLQGIGISTLDDLASGIVDRGDEIAAYITSSAAAAVLGSWRHKSVSRRHRQRRRQPRRRRRNCKRRQWLAAELSSRPGCCETSWLLLMALWLLSSSVRRRAQL